MLDKSSLSSWRLSLQRRGGGRGRAVVVGLSCDGDCDRHPDHNLDGAGADTQVITDYYRGGKK